jgi:limonene-1,2-epoxide hydrolase
MTAGELVAEFIAAIERKDVESALELVADDIEYENVPIAVVTGLEAVRSGLTPFIEGASEIEWVVHCQVSDEATVMNERTDRFRMGDRWMEIRVAGVWTVRDGKIAVWRDYFDLATFTAQMSGGG